MVIGKFGSNATIYKLTTTIDLEYRNMKRLLSAAILALTFMSGAQAALYEISFISDDFGDLGGFTIESQDIIDNLGDNPLGGNYVSNDYIQSLDFSYNGLSWDSGDIAIGATTAHYYFFNGVVPLMGGGNGALASGQNGSIVVYNGQVQFGSDFVAGKWESALAPAPVPIPAGLWLFGSAIAGLIGFRAKRA